MRIGARNDNGEMISPYFLQDFSIKTDYAVEARRADMIVEDNERTHKEERKITDFAMPHYNRVNTKEIEKIEKYHVLDSEMK